jgi:Transglycosylase associated protein.
VTGVNIESIVIAVIGAIIVLFVWRALTRNQAS